MCQICVVNGWKQATFHLVVCHEKKKTIISILVVYILGQGMDHLLKFLK